MATNTATSFTPHTAPSSGSTAGPYAISFDYLEQSDVDVTVNGTLQALGVSYTFTSGTQITFTSGNEPANGAAIVIRRDTNISAKKVDFQDGSVLTETDLDTNTEQILFGLQEFTDKINGIEDGATGDQTPAEILAAIVQVDGAGSGLDADKLDGQEGSYYLDYNNLTNNPTSLTLGNIRIGVTGANEIDTSSGALTIDSASGDTTVDDNLTVTGNLIVNGSNINIPNAPFLSTVNADIATGSLYYFGANTSTFPTTKIRSRNVPFEFGGIASTPAAGGFNGSCTMSIGGNMAGIYDGNQNQGILNDLNLGHANLGLPLSSELNSNVIGHVARISLGRMYMTETGSSSTASPIIMRAAYPDGLMFYHPDTTMVNGGFTSGGPLGSANQNNTYAENITDARNAADMRIISGGIFAKNKVEIGSSSVAGTLSLSGQDVTATGDELNVLDGFAGSTSELNKLNGLTASTTELNLLANKTVVTSIAGNATDNQLPSAQAVNERIVELVTEVGGFVPIANETSFPTTNPDVNDGAGTIVSIADAGGLKVANGSGSGTYAGTAGNSIGATTTAGTAVTITGIDSSLHGTTIGAGKGILVETTTTLNEYVYHRLVLDEAGVSNADTLVSNFNERYYGPLSSNPATRPSGANRQDGDLYFNTSDNKMKVYNGTHASGTWDDVATPGNFFINTLSTSSGSGGGQSAFDGTATRFTLSNPPLTAQQLLVSINGVIQKPNSGTSPSEGFAIDGADIIFAAPPALNAPFFIVTIGSSVNIGTPSDGTVTTVKLDDGAVTDAKVSSSAGILGTKISPNFGSQNVQTSGSITVDGSTADTIIKNTGIEIEFTRAGANYINASNASGSLQLFTANSPRLVIDNTGKIGVGTTSPINIIHATGSTTNAGYQFINTNSTDGYGVYISGGGTSSGRYALRVDDAAGNERFRILTGGNVGIGTTSPSGPLHVYKSSGASRSYYESGDSHTFIRLLGGSTSHNSGLEFFSGSSTNTANITALSTGSLVFDTGSTNDAVTINSSGAIGIKSSAPQANIDIVDTNPMVLIRPTDGNSGKARLYIGGGGANQDKCAIIFDPANGFCRGSLKFCLDNTADVSNADESDAKLTLKPDGNVEIVDGNLAVASGHGIDFSAVSDGSRSVDSNLLNDYEQGTFSPAISQGVDNGSGGSPTYNNQSGNYVKIGRLVQVSYFIQLNTTVGTVFGTGVRLHLTGLPFTIQAISGQHNGFGGTNYHTMVTNVGSVPIMHYGSQNGTDIECYYGSTSVAPTNNTDQYGRYLIGGFTYHTNA